MKQINNELKTSYGNIDKLPRAIHTVEALGFKKVVNYGCGLGGFVHKEMLKGRVELINYEPFIEELSNKPAFDVEADAVICNCVLNVIESDEIIESILDDFDRYHEQGKTIIITIYEGDRTGNKRVMSGGTYQRNTKEREYEMIAKRGYILKKRAWIKA